LHWLPQHFAETVSICMFLEWRKTTNHTVEKFFSYV
jgi:hypothetical protein